MNPPSSVPNHADPSSVDHHVEGTGPLFNLLVRSHATPSSTDHHGEGTGLLFGLLFFVIIELTCLLLIHHLEPGFHQSLNEWYQQTHPQTQPAGAQAPR